ncbi:MAG TPA: hypothetical protein VGE41_11300, partial [Verrucomicrobiae bacterium]
ALLSEFYHVWGMRSFTFFVFAPAVLVLIALAVWDRAADGGALWRAVMIGLTSGFLAAIAYDIFRLPFVYARQLGIENWLHPLPLFKVFPQFGALILGQATGQNDYSAAAHILGWLYHFSNGAMFGAMYMAMIGEAERRCWGWAVLMAAGLEAGMLFTPYASAFGIKVTPYFVTVTLAAHIIFGVALGLASRWMARRWNRVVVANG